MPLCQYASFQNVLPLRSTNKRTSLFLSIRLNCTQRLHCDVQQNSEQRTPRGGVLGLIPGAIWFALRTQLAQQPEQIALIHAAWQQVPKYHLSIWTVHSFTFGYCCVRAELFGSWFIETFIVSLPILDTASLYYVWCPAPGKCVKLPKCLLAFSIPLCFASTCIIVIMLWQPCNAFSRKHEAVAPGCAETCVRLLISEQITSVGTNQDSPGVKAPLAYVKRNQIWLAHTVCI